MSFFDQAYLGSPPWDIGREQGAYRHLAQNLGAKIKGPILDVGCGTGENSLFFAGLGYETTGIDSSYLAISKALEKADARNLHDKATFLTMDLFDLSELDKKFNTVIDSGVFHMFDSYRRGEYQKSIKNVLNKGGQLYILAFSYLETANIGPSQRLTQNDYMNAFKDLESWKINQFEQCDFETRTSRTPARGLLTSIDRV